MFKFFRKQSDNNHGIQLKKTGQFWTKPSDFETVHLDSLMDTLNVSRTGFPMEDLFFQYNWCAFCFIFFALEYYAVCV